MIDAYQPAPSHQHRRGKFLRMAAVVQSVGLSQATINRLHRAGDFPAKVRISGNATGWWEGEIEAWKASREAIAMTS